MRASTLPTVFALATLAAACGDQAPGPTDSLQATVNVAFSSADPKNGHTHLSGDQEIPARETEAQGQLKLQLAADGMSISYTLIATNIENILQAHLHLAPADANGPIVAWLYPAAPPAMLIPGRHTGVLATGEITTLVGPLEGADIQVLWEEIKAGRVYANVHTSQFPGGEVRGQVATGG